MSSKGKEKKRLKKKVSNPPGSLVYRGKKQTQEVKVRIIRFGPDSYEEVFFTGSRKEISHTPGQTTWSR